MEASEAFMFSGNKQVENKNKIFSGKIKIDKLMFGTNIGEKSKFLYGHCVTSKPYISGSF